MAHPKRFLDVVPLTRLLDTPHMRPSPAMTLASLRADPIPAPTGPGPHVPAPPTTKIMDDPATILEEDIRRLKQELRYWRQTATASRNILKIAGIQFGDSWEAEDKM